MKIDPVFDNNILRLRFCNENTKRRDGVVIENRMGLLSHAATTYLDCYFNIIRITIRLIKQY